MPCIARTSRLALAASAASLALLATACGGGSGSDASGPGDGKPVTLTFWSSALGAKETADAFNKTQTGIRIKFSLVPAGPEGVTKLSNAVKGGNAPDVATMDYSALPEYASEGNLVDLTPSSGELVKEEFPEALQSLVNLGGSTWAVPFDVTPIQLFYRKDLFKKHGVEVPTTWAEYRTAAEKIHRADPDVTITNFGGGDPLCSPASPGEAGAQWYGTNGDAWKVNIDDPASRKVAAYWDDLLADGLASKTPLWGEGEARNAPPARSPPSSAPPGAPGPSRQLPGQQRQVGDSPCPPGTASRAPACTAERPTSCRRAVSTPRRPPSSSSGSPPTPRP